MLAPTTNSQFFAFDTFVNGEDRLFSAGPVPVLDSQLMPGLFEPAGVMRGGVAEAGALACDAPAAAGDGAAPSHVGGCVCEACALPAFEGSDGQQPGTDGGALDQQLISSGQWMAERGEGPAQGVIDASVDASVVPNAGAGVALGDTFKLHSLPGAKYTVYLDFDGHVTTGTAWNSYWGTPTINSPAFSTDASATFNATELLRIQQIWQRMAEYFSPFNINVTTEDPGVEALRFGGATDRNGHGIRVVITDENGKNFGGIAYKGSFNWTTDTPTFVYANRLSDSPKNIADAAAHEVGHTLGLDHDGRGRSEYYYGHGSGTTDWAPIMGVGYSANIVQWSKGDYNGASRLEDDLTIITTRNNGVAYRADDHGNTFATATLITGVVGGGVARIDTYGIISGSGARNDIDMFRFDVAAGGAIDFTVSTGSRAFVSGAAAAVHAASPFSMLDVGLVLYDAAYNIVATSDDTARIDGRLQLSGLAGGTYFLAVDGVGWGNPMANTPTGYTDYGSLGQYVIRGTFTVPGGLVGGPAGGGGGGTAGSGAGAGGSGVASPVLSVDRTAINMIEGATEAFTMRMTGATGEVAVRISGIVAGEASLSVSEVLLNAANNWAATLNLTALPDRDVGSDIAYTLRLDSDATEAVEIAVTSRDNDLAAATSGRASGSYTTAVGFNSTIARQNTDDGKLNTYTEGVFRNGEIGMEVRWEFRSLGAGDRLVQLDAFSANEAFRFEYSVDGARTWRRFDGAADSALSWNGSFLAQGVASNLWVRLLDTNRAGDTARDTIQVDLLTVASPLGPAATDLLFA